jgi:F-type H+-transporting ATPase subunit delta
MDSNARILAKRYARAYMALDGKAHSKAAEAASEERLDALEAVLKAALPHARALSHPALGAEVRLEVLGKVLAGLKGPAVQFASLLVQKGRFALAPEVLRCCRELHDAFCGVLRAEVRSRYPLSEGELKRLAGLLLAGGPGKVALHPVQDEALLGGFEVKVGDLLIDATVRGRLDALRAGLRKT